MNTSAIVMLVISIILLWGGLIFAIWHLFRHPESDHTDD